MPYIPPKVLAEIKKIDLLTYLKNYEPDELVYIGKDTYVTKEHDSLKISNGLWNWFSAGIGGKNAIDYLEKVKGYSFMEAVEIILKNKSIQAPIYEEKRKGNRHNELILPEKIATMIKRFHI